MATYKIVMRPALEYAFSIWSPLASSTSINKLQVIIGPLLFILYISDMNNVSNKIFPFYLLVTPRCLSKAII